MPRLTIRKKTIISITCTMAILSIIIGVNLYHFKQQNLYKIETIIGHKNLQLAQSVLDVKQRNLMAYVEMFAHNDRFWKFAAGDQHMVPDPRRFDTLNLEIVAIFDQQQLPLYLYTSHSEHTIAKQVVLNIVQSYPQLLSSTLHAGQRSGIVVLDGRPFLLAVQPIIPSLYQADYAGFLLTGLFIDDLFWQQANSEWNINANVGLIMQVDPSLHSDESTIHTQIILNDINGQPVVVLENNSPFSIVKIIQHGFKTFITLLLVACLVVLIFTCGVLEKLFIRRLHNLDARLQHIGGAGNDERVKIIFDDEIGSIAISINAMLDRLQSGQQRLKLIEKVFETTTEAIVITDSDNNIVDVNQAFVDLSGYCRSEMMGQNPRVLKSQCHSDAFYTQMWQQIVTSGHWSGEVWDTRKNGEEYPKWLIIDTLKDCVGATEYYIGVSVDLFKIKAAEQRLHQLAYFDHLTKLPNRTSFCESLEQQLQQQLTQQGDCGQDGSLAVIILDIDSFKQINEVHGPEQADRLLQLVASRLEHCMFEDGVLARFGGDEFALLIDSALCEQQVQLLSDCMHAPFALGLHQVSLTMSIGIALAPQHGRSVVELIKNADVALYSIQNFNRNCHKYFHHSMNDMLLERMELAEMLRVALANDEFELYYQPKIDLRDGTIIGAEALLRWHSPNGMIPPDRFIPIAEETGLIIPIGEWVLREACLQMSEWRCIYPSLHIAVNVSPLQFDLDYLPQLVAEILQQTALPAAALELEITEETTIKDIDKTVEVLQKMHGLGVALSMDDFGTGYSSLSYLTRLPVDMLKIDRSFMEGVPASKNDTNVVLAILSMARSLDLKVTAEGAETSEHIMFLKENNCDYVQGYFCSRPLSAAKFFDFMQKKQGKCHKYETIIGS